MNIQGNQFCSQKAKDSPGGLKVFSRAFPEREDGPHPSTGITTPLSSYEDTCALLPCPRACLRLAFWANPRVGREAKWRLVLGLLSHHPGHVHKRGQSWPDRDIPASSCSQGLWLNQLKGTTGWTKRCSRLGHNAMPCVALQQWGLLAPPPSAQSTARPPRKCSHVPVRTSSRPAAF